MGFGGRCLKDKGNGVYLNDINGLEGEVTLTTLCDEPWGGGGTMPRDLILPL